MAEQGGLAPATSERLARLYFDLARDGDVPNLLGLCHEDVELTLKTRSGKSLRGRDEVARFLAEVSESNPLFEATAERFRVVDGDRVIVEGRMRWMDADRVLRDDPVVWALEFRDGLLLRSMPVRSVGEAEAALLRASPAGASRGHERGRRT